MYRIGWILLLSFILVASGCGGPRENRFAANPVSRSIEPQEGLGLRDFAPSPSLGPAVGRNPLAARCEAELSGQSRFPFNFRTRSLKGRTLSKSQFAGRLLVVDIWATWCGPCVREVPHFIDLQRRYGDRGLSMVGFNYERGADERENRRHVESFAAEQGINYPLALGDHSITEQIPGFRGYPTTLFIDGNGHVRLTLRGARSLDELETFVKLLLDDPSIDPGRSRYRPDQQPEKPPEIQSNPFVTRLQQSRLGGSRIDDRWRREVDQRVGVLL